MGNLQRCQNVSQVLEYRRTESGGVSYMYIFFPELLVQTLAQCTEAELARRKRACRLVSPPAGRCAREDQRTTLANHVKLVRLEGSDSKLRKCKRGADIRVKRFCDLLVCDLQERLPDTVRSVVDCNAQCMRRRWPVFLDSRERRGQRGRIVCLYLERRSLCRIRVLQISRLL